MEMNMPAIEHKREWIRARAAERDAGPLSAATMLLLMASGLIFGQLILGRILLLISP
jgi:hypothetical protein